MTLAEQLAAKHATYDHNRGTRRKHKRWTRVGVVAAIEEAIEKCAQEVEYDSAGSAARIRALLTEGK